MWYAIVGGVGLLLGVALLTWALRERSIRANAESVATAAVNSEATALEHLADARETVNAQALDLTRTRVQLDTLRGTVDELRKRLVDCKDPKTVQEWLLAELKEETV